MNNKGFSLAEIVIAAGLIGGLGLALMQMTRNQSEVMKRAEASTEINAMYNRLTQVLLNKEACENTFGLNSEIINGASVDEVLSRRGDVIYKAGSIYGNRAIKITSFTLADISYTPVVDGIRNAEGQLEVTFEKISKLIKGAVVTKKKLPISFELNGSNQLLKCYSAVENAVQTARKESCESISGVFDESTSMCNLSKLTVEVGGVVSSLSTSEICVAGNCRDFTDKTCPSGQFVRGIKADGSLDCSIPEAPEGTVTYLCPKHGDIFHRGNSVYSKSGSTCQNRQTAVSTCTGQVQFSAQCTAYGCGTVGGTCSCGASASAFSFECIKL